jgi:hypothetical protein
MSAFPLLPISQAQGPAPFDVKPSITVVGSSEFLLLSWTGASTLGLFVTGNGDPVRGTLEWLSHPEAICEFVRNSFDLEEPYSLDGNRKVLITPISPPYSPTTPSRYTA